MMRCCITILGILMLASVSLAQDHTTEATVETAKVAGNVYILTGPGGNVGLSIGEDGTLMIDDKFLPLAEKIQAQIDSLGGAAPKFLINTHWHGDHTGGNEHFGRNATIIAHDHVRTRLMTDQDRNGRITEAKPKIAWPVITFDDSLSVHFNGEEIKALHFPHSHTDGDVALWFTGSNVLHTGDLFFNGRFPFVDMSSGGNAFGLRASVRKLLDEIPDDIWIIPGHGPLAKKVDLQKYYDMLNETIDFVMKQKESGKTKEQIVAGGLPEKWSDMGWSLVSTEKWIETIYDSDND